MKDSKNHQILRLIKMGTILYLMLVILNACEEDEEEKIYFYLQGNPSVVDMPSSAKTLIIPVYSNGFWKIEPFSGEDWVSIDPKEGEGDGLLTIITDHNQSSRGRSLYLEFSATNMKYNKALEIKQGGVPQIFIIEGNPTGLKVDMAGTTQSYAVISNGTWRIEAQDDADWVTINPIEGDDDGTFTITVSKNTDPESRITNLDFYVNDQKQSAEFIITQKGAGGVMVDIDGNEYRTVFIGGREWMAENLRVTRYRDGTPISGGLTNAEWSSTTSGAYAIYPHESIDGISSDEEMAETYGLLYNWYAVSNSGELAPQGWRVPTDEDWQELEIAAGMSPQDAAASSWRGSPVGFRLKGIGGGWAESHNNTDDFDFSVYPIGARDANGTYDARVGMFAFYWTATPSGANYTRRVFQSDGRINKGTGGARAGYSIRCVRTP